MHKFGLSIQDSQFHLFLFLASVAAGTLIGGPLGSFWTKIHYLAIHFRGAFYVALPYANLFWTGILSVIIGVVIASFFGNFSFCSGINAGKSGYDFGIIFGFAFGMGGLGSAFGLLG
jgi:FSR family fosmidomycin resistance protein-like MFS transporter